MRGSSQRTRRPLGVVGVVATALLMQGCADLRLDGGPAPAEQASEPVPARKPEVVQPEVAALPAPAETPVEPSVEVEELLGLDFDSVRGLLGTPALEEIKPPATVWAYNGRGCVLSIFFYPHVDGGTYRALTYDVKGGADTTGLAQRCFSELLQEGRKTGTN